MGSFSLKVVGVCTIAFIMHNLTKIKAIPDWLALPSVLGNFFSSVPTIIILLEVAFYLYFRSEVKSLQWVRLPPQRSTALTFEGRERIFYRMLGSISVEKWGDARDVESFLKLWFLNTVEDIHKIRRGNLLQWFSWALFYRFPNELSGQDQVHLESFVGRFEKHVGITFPAGMDPSQRSMRLTLDTMTAIHRPLTMYCTIILFNSISKIVMSKVFGFTRRRIGGFNYWYRYAENKTTPEYDNTSSRPSTHRHKLPIVFIHGLGQGLMHYLNFVFHVKDRDVFILELSYISSRVGENIPESHEVADVLSTILQEHNYSRAIFMGHSFGTFTVNWCIRYRPEMVHSIMLIDPVTLITCYPTTCYSFVYHSPVSIMEWVRYLVVAKELGIARVMNRHFWWQDNCMFADDIPYKTPLSNQPDRCAFYKSNPHETGSESDTDEEEDYVNNTLPSYASLTSPLPIVGKQSETHDVVDEVPEKYLPSFGSLSSASSASSVSPPSNMLFESPSPPLSPSNPETSPTTVAVVGSITGTTSIASTSIVSENDLTPAPSPRAIGLSPRSHVFSSLEADSQSLLPPTFDPRSEKTAKSSPAAGVLQRHRAESIDGRDPLYLPFEPLDSELDVYGVFRDLRGHPSGQNFVSKKLGDKESHQTTSSRSKVLEGEKAKEHLHGHNKAKDKDKSPSDPLMHSASSGQSGKKSLFYRALPNPNSIAATTPCLPPPRNRTESIVNTNAFTDTSQGAIHSSLPGYDVSNLNVASRTETQLREMEARSSFPSTSITPGRTPWTGEDISAVYCPSRHREAQMHKKMFTETLESAYGFAPLVRSNTEPLIPSRSHDGSHEGSNDVDDQGQDQNQDQIAPTMSLPPMHTNMHMPEMRRMSSTSVSTSGIEGETGVISRPSLHRSMTQIKVGVFLAGYDDLLPPDRIHRYLSIFYRHRFQQALGVLGLSGKAVDPAPINMAQSEALDKEYKNHEGDVGGVLASRASVEDLNRMIRTRVLYEPELGHGGILFNKRARENVMAMVRWLADEE